MKAIVILAAVLVGFGAVSSRWFDTLVGDEVIHQGVLSAQVCGFGLGHRADELEEFGRWQATGVLPPVRPWECEREFNALQIIGVRSVVDIALWVANLISVVAGLAAAALLLNALRGRRPFAKGIAIVAALGLASGVAFVGTLIATGEYNASDLSFGAAAYGAGALLALWCASRLSRRALPA